MAANRMARVFALLALAGATLGGCRDEPTPPATTASAESPSTSTAGAQRPPARKRVSAQATKLYRLESCYFGTAGLLYAKQAYEKSLAGGEPGPGKVPEFGVFTPEPKPKPGVDGGAASPAAPKATPPAPKHDPRRPRRFAKGQRLPFARYARACTIAESLKEPPSPELDAELGKYQSLVGKLNKSLQSAQRYYQTKKHEEDGFKRGKELHQEIVKGFADLEPQMTALGEALEAWRAKLGPAGDEIGETGKLSETAVAEARALTLLLMGAKVDAKAVAEAIAKVTEAADALKAIDKKDSPFVRMLVPQLNKYQQMTARAEEEVKGGALSLQTRHFVTAAFTRLCETQYRAVTRQLRSGHRRHGKAGRPGHPLRGMDPKPPVRALTPPIHPAAKKRTAAPEAPEEE